MESAHVFTPATAAGYLAGMIDGEGSVYHGRVGKKRPQQIARVVSITNTDHGLLDACAEACRVLGIYCTRASTYSKPPKREAWRILIHDRDAFEILLKTPIHSAKKRAKLEGMVASYTHRTHRPPERVLRELYEVRGYSANDLCRRFHVAPPKVAGWLASYGIETRTKSEQGKVASDRQSPERRRETALRAWETKRAKSHPT